MADLCDANELMASARCFHCTGAVSDVITYLLAKVTNSSTIPNSLLDNAKAICCLRGMEEEVLIYLLTQIVQPDDTTPNGLLEESKCYKCIPHGMQDEVIASLLAEILGLTDLQSITEESRCMKCIPEGKKLQVWDWMLNAMLSAQQQFQAFIPPPGFVGQGAPNWYGPDQSINSFGYQTPYARIHWNEVGGATFEGSLDYFYANATLSQVTNIVIDGQGITSIWGLNTMPLLEGLILNNNNLQVIDLTGCTHLQIFECDNNPALDSMFGWASMAQLRSFSANGCHSIGSFNFNSAPLLITLRLHNVIWQDNTDITSLVNLQYLDLGMDSPNFGVLGTMQFLSFDLLTQLYYLDLARQNQLPSISLPTGLKHLDLSYTQIPTIDLSLLTLLEYFDCSYQTTATGRMVTLGNHVVLTTLKCADNRLAAQLDYSGCLALQYIDINHSDNQLTFHSKLHPALTYADFSHTTVNDFNYDDPSSIKTLKMAETAVVSVDTTKFSNLEWFDASRVTAGGLVGSIDFTDCPNLSVVYLGLNSGVTDLLFLINPGPEPTPPSPMTFLDASTCGLAIGNQVSQDVGLMANLVSLNISNNTGVTSVAATILRSLRFLNIAGCHVANSSYIDALLKVCNSFHGIGTFGIIDMRFGTNSTPSPVGVGYKNSLVSKGWIVETK